MPKTNLRAVDDAYSRVREEMIFIVDRVIPENRRLIPLVIDHAGRRPSDRPDGPEKQDLEAILDTLRSLVDLQTAAAAVVAANRRLRGRLPEVAARELGRACRGCGGLLRPGDSRHGLDGRCAKAWSRASKAARDAGDELTLGEWVAARRRGWDEVPAGDDDSAGWGEAS